MKEDFLHYLWKFKKFNTSDLETTNHQNITILHAGQYLQSAGPDFFNAQLIIENQKWAGNIEIHLKSSDWYLHHHETDASYDNVILHVVWEHNVNIFRKDNTEIPTLELKNYVDQETIVKYQLLVSLKTWIYCENQIQQVPDFIMRNWKERLFFERLERKSEFIDVVLQQTHNDWEATLFMLLAKNFGLNINGPVFFKIASAIPFSIIRKESAIVESLEALLFGVAGLLDEEKEDVYFTWDNEYKFNNNNCEPISISIDGDTNGPFSNTLQKTYQIMDTISELQSKIQTKIDLQFPEKNIDLKRDFNLEDLYIYLEEETNSLEYEFEYYSNDSEIMISVEFVNDEIEAVEFY
jgi:hypothetical protein